MIILLLYIFDLMWMSQHSIDFLGMNFKISSMIKRKYDLFIFEISYLDWAIYEQTIVPAKRS